jgi:hypothetical protein
MKELKDFEKLRWVRVFTPIHIPKYLVEQVRDRDYTVEDFYRYQENSCVRMTGEGPTLNPLNHLYVLADEENLTKGFVWFTVDPLSKDICLHTYSIDKEYWNKGKAVSKVAEFILDIKRKGQLNKVYWVTNYPKHSQRYGFRPSKSVLMEYKEGKNGKDANGRSDTRGEHRSSDAPTTTISVRDHDSSDDRNGSASIPELSTAAES